MTAITNPYDAPHLFSLPALCYDPSMDRPLSRPLDRPPGRPQDYPRVRPLEPGLLRIFRYFTGIAMLYFALLLGYAFIQTGQGFTLQQDYSFIESGQGFALLAQSSLNFLTNLVLFIYLSLPWLERRLKRWYLPLALLAASVVPVFSNLLYLAAPPEPNIYLIVARSWLLLPILVVPLVLIAWQYPFRAVMLFIIFSTLVELSVLFPVVSQIDTQNLPLLGTPLIRAFAFGVVGHIVHRLVDTQRAQRTALVQANLQLAQHAQTLEHLAASRERNRLARELHDTLAHTLSGLAVNLEAIKTVAPADTPEAAAMLDHSLAITRTGLAETRRALKDLRAQPLEDLGLSLAIRALALTVAARANLELDLDLPAEMEDLAPAVEQNLYRIAQEALENIARHAGARHATLRLQRDANHLTLTIRDDGRGIPGDQSPDGFGLQGMRERAAEIGARFSFSSLPDQGVEIHLELDNPSSPDAPPAARAPLRLPSLRRRRARSQPAGVQSPEAKP